MTLNSKGRMLWALHSGTYTRVHRFWVSGSPLEPSGSGTVFLGTPPDPPKTNFGGSEAAQDPPRTAQDCLRAISNSQSGHARNHGNPPTSWSVECMGSPPIHPHLAATPFQSTPVLPTSTHPSFGPAGLESAMLNFDIESIEPLP